jgi:hypothetical protein
VLEVETTIVNLSDEPMPVAVGFRQRARRVLTAAVPQSCACM